MDQSAEPLIEDARRRNVGLVNAAPFGGGMLVKGPDLQPKYCYAPASQATFPAIPSALISRTTAATMAASWISSQVM